MPRTQDKKSSEEILETIQRMNPKRIISYQCDIATAAIFLFILPPFRETMPGAMAAATIAAIAAELTRLRHLKKQSNLYPSKVDRIHAESRAVKALAVTQTLLTLGAWSLIFVTPLSWTTAKPILIPVISTGVITMTLIQGYTMVTLFYRTKLLKKLSRKIQENTETESAANEN